MHLQDRKGLGIPTCQRIPLAPPARLDMDLSDDKAIQEAIAEAMADAAVSAHRHPRPAAATVAPSYHSPAQRATQSRSSAANGTAYAAYCTVEFRPFSIVEFPCQSALPMCGRH